MDRPPWWKAGGSWVSKSSANSLCLTQPPAIVGRIRHRDPLLLQLLNHNQGFMNIDDYLNPTARRNHEANMNQAAILNPDSDQNQDADLNQAAVLNAILNQDVSLNQAAGLNQDMAPNVAVNLNVADLNPDEALNQDANLNGDVNENPEGNMNQENGENVQDDGLQEPGLQQEMQVEEEQVSQAPVEGAQARSPQTRHQRAPRSKFTPKELYVLESVFQKVKYPDLETRRALAKNLGVTEAKVQIWFKNKRAKCRRCQRALMNQNENENVASSQHLYFLMRQGP